MLPDTLKEIPAAAALEALDGSAIEDSRRERGEITLLIAPGKIVAACRFLKEEWKFNRLSSVTAVDWNPRQPRFDVVYHLHSIERGERLRLISRVSEELDSVTGVWPAADWYEREVFDLFGITFRNHPNLRRIMMPEDWQGHPLRKDFPIHGHRYSYGDPQERKGEQ